MPPFKSSHTSPIRSKITHQTSRQANKQATAALSSCEASSMKVNKNLQLLHAIFCMPTILHGCVSVLLPFDDKPTRKTEQGRKDLNPFSNVI